MPKQASKSDFDIWMTLSMCLLATPFTGTTSSTPFCFFFFLVKDITGFKYYGQQFNHISKTCVIFKGFIVIVRWLPEKHSDSWVKILHYKIMYFFSSKSHCKIIYVLHLARCMWYFPFLVISYKKQYPNSFCTSDR